MSDSAIKGQFDAIRRTLDGWREALPKNAYTGDANLRSSLATWLGPDELAKHEDLLARTGADVAGDLYDWVIENNRDENLPALRRFDGNGNRTEGIAFHPLYHDIGRRMYGSGIMSLYEKPGRDVLQMALFYLFSQNGEAGHNCPLACTAGAIKLLGRAGSDELKAKYLPRLLDPDYDTHMHASQFLTELQGGSDVGANLTEAVEQEDGTWRLFGEKWFCSVIDAQLWVLTARTKDAPAGTKGLTTFVAPRYLDDGTPNHFEVKRLKYKIGTRSMASGEVDLNGMVAFNVGAPGEGFKHVVEVVLNTSRLYNALAAAGVVRRAYVEAMTFAAAREAFGAPIAQYPLVKRSLAFLRREAAAQLSSSMLVAKLTGKIADGTADNADAAEFRFLVNANKYATSIGATKSVREAIEVLGGNGTIEEFSILPRLYRDAIVLESWEGTHNVLCQQVLKDMAKYKVHEAALDRAEQRARDREKGSLGQPAAVLREEIVRCRVSAENLLQMDPADAQLHVRAWIDRVMAAVQGTTLLYEAAAEKKRGEDTGKADILLYHVLKEVERPKLFGNSGLAALEKGLA